MSNAAEVLLVASSPGRMLDFVDLQTLSRLHSIPDLTAQPHEIAFDEHRRFAYVAHTYRAGGYGEDRGKGHEISVIDVDARSVADVIDIAPFFGPHDVEYDPVNDVIVTGVERIDGRNGLVLVDPARRQVIASIPLAAPNAHWLAITPDGARAYVTHKEAEVVSVVDLRARAQIGEIRSPFGAEEVDCSPDGRFVYVAVPMMSIVVRAAAGSIEKAPRSGGPRPAVVQIDVASDEIVGRCHLDEYASALRVAPDGRVLVSEFQFREPGSDVPAPGFLHVIDPATMGVRASIQCEELPFTIRCASDGRRAFVANLKTGTVTVVDLADYTVCGLIDNNAGVSWGGTHGLCAVSARADA